MDRSDEAEQIRLTVAQIEIYDSVLEKWFGCDYGKLLSLA